jgi:hypothetical protein
MERAAAFRHDDNTQAKLDKLDALLAKSLTPPQDAALLADMLSLSTPARQLEESLRQRNYQRIRGTAIYRGRPGLQIEGGWLRPR